MSKRIRDQEDGNRPPKRAKSTHVDQTSELEEVEFARQLQQLLTFRQDGIHQLRRGIASFKVFLDGILYRQDNDDRPRKLAILHEFLDSEKPADITDTERPFFGQLWQAWSFATQNNDDTLCSAVGSIFALLLKTLSGILDLRDHGLLLCRTVLQHQHLRLLKKCLDAPMQKEFVISPCVRLLTEVASFDGGVLSREVYKRREQTFEIWMLRRSLNSVKTDVSEEEARRRPSLRTHTMRYILALLKHLHEGGKIDLLRSRPLCTALFSRLQDDPTDVVNELLSITELNVLKDGDLPRSAKAALLVQHNLERVTDIATRSRDGHAASSRAYEWLRTATNTPSYGIFRLGSWYPPGTAYLEQRNDGNETIDLGLDSLEFYDRVDRPDVRNPTLLGWIQYLRPQSNDRERDLLIDCFKSAPELVAAYFAEKTMQLEPKLTNTWIGYASFLYEIVTLPLPDFLGNEHAWASLPPQTCIMIESILPRPLNQKVLTRCLNQSSELVTFFAVRILVVAFGKLSQVLSLLEKRITTVGAHTSLWLEARERLLARFAERCPRMKDVIIAFRRLPNDNEHALQREATTRLLMLYYEVSPTQALEEQFDISTPLTAALTDSTLYEFKELKEVRTLELEHMLQIAQRSTGMRWLHKHGALEVSPLTTLLRLHTKTARNAGIRELLGHVLIENNILANSNVALEALIASLIDLPDQPHQNGLWDFLDDCFARASRKPVKYVDDLEDLITAAQSDPSHFRSSSPLPSLLVAVLLEQIPYVLEKEAKSEIMSWIELFMELLSKFDSSCRVSISLVRMKLSQVAGWESPQPNLSEVEARLSRVRLLGCDADMKDTAFTEAIDEMSIPFAVPPSEVQNHPELFKWAKKDLDIAFGDGDVESLMLCLCSQYPDIRKQALGQLYKLEDKLHSSGIEDKDAIYVLVGELIETYERHYEPQKETLPFVAGVFATQALRVQMEPTHFMYAKINRYLNKGPEWRVQKLPSYWIDNVFLSQPDEDDGYWKEVQWVLDWLVNCLRTAADLEILRRCGVPERVMSLYASPGAAVHKATRERILEFVWRVSRIEGGSTTLITRTGVVSWLKMLKKGDNGLEDAIRDSILESCDRLKVETWSGLWLDKL